MPSVARRASGARRRSAVRPAARATAPTKPAKRRARREGRSIDGRIRARREGVKCRLARAANRGYAPGMIHAALLLALSAPPARAARDVYADLRPLVGTWVVDRSCGPARDRVIVRVARQSGDYFAEFLDPRDETTRLGTASILPIAGQEDRFRLGVRLANNAVLKALGLDVLPATLVFSDDPDDEESGKKDYLSVSSTVGPLNSLTTVKLRGGGRATYLFKAETPMSQDRCRGTAVKRKEAAKKG